MRTTRKIIRVRAFPLFPRFDEPCELDIPRRPQQHRMRNDGAFNGCGSKARDQRSKADAQGEPDEMPAAKNSDSDRQAQEQEGSPWSGFLIDGKVNQNAASECDRYPGDQAACTKLGERPAANAARGTGNKIAHRVEKAGPCADGPSCGRAPGRSASCAFLPFRHSCRPNSFPRLWRRYNHAMSAHDLIRNSQRPVRAPWPNYRAAQWSG
jgi:hypothetical protein